MVRKDAKKFASTVSYHQLGQDDDETVELNEFSCQAPSRISCNEDFIAAQFERGPTRIPWKAICLAAGLLIFGTVLLVLGSLLFTGYFHADYAESTWPLILLGALMFIPGSYHTYIAYYAFKGCRGYSFDDIPSFDD